MAIHESPAWQEWWARAQEAYADLKELQAAQAADYAAFRARQLVELEVVRARHREEQALLRNRQVAERLLFRSERVANTERYLEAHALRREGKTYREIGRQLALSATRARDLVAKGGAIAALRDAAGIALADGREASQTGDGGRMDDGIQRSHDDPTRGTYTMREAQRVIGVGQSTLRALVRNGTLPVIRIGRRVLLPRNHVDDFTAVGGTARTR